MFSRTPPQSRGRTRGTPPPNRRQVEKYETPLDELSHRLDRLEVLVQQTKTSYVESLKPPPPPSQTSALPPSGRKNRGWGVLRGRSIRNNSNSEVKDGNTSSSSNNTAIAAASVSLDTVQDESTAAATTVETDQDKIPQDEDTTLDNTAEDDNQGDDDDDDNDDNLNTETPKKTKFPVKFIPMNKVDQDECIEVLRRIAELVVLGERAAASALARCEKREKRRQQEQSAWGNEITDDFLDSMNTPEEDDKIDADAADKYIALFEHFFERKALSLVVDIVTGTSFTPTQEELEQPTDEQAEEEPPKLELEADVLLPPVAIATQAIQSMSILVQNVSRATSLYFLLSNNHINELINLPLERYSAAERIKCEGFLPPGSDSAFKLFSSPELAELTTHFVTFLKSLALRMNVETLQFFLTYPSEGEGGEIASSAHFGANGEIGERKADGARPVHLREVRVDFPLYARALDFCSADHDSFVRVTAMNICLNTLRLVTIITDDDEEEGDSQTQHGSSPDGVLHNAVPLPLRERLAIAQHVCAPSRVQRLVSPLFTKLAKLWSMLEEQLREMDMASVGLGDSAVPIKKIDKVKARAKRESHAKKFNNIAADLQDELMMLGDVLKAGLISLNEQTIEMMLATFVYPLLLQPLLLFFQRFPSANEIRFDELLAKPDTVGVEVHEVIPAKTALFVLTAVFHFVSNRTLLRLLFTALFHPLAPDSSGGIIYQAAPDVAGVDRKGKVSIRIDTEDLTETGLISGTVSSYSFGTCTGTKVSSTESGEEMDNCIFVLSPGLAEVLKSTADDSTVPAGARANPHRQAILKCLSASHHMSGLRALSVATLDSALSLFSSEFVRDMLFRSEGVEVEKQPADGQSQPSAAVASDCTTEVITSLCSSVMRAAPFLLGTWKLEYDEVAAHALLCGVQHSSAAIETAAKLIERRWHQSTAFVSEAPSQMHKTPNGGAASSSPRSVRHRPTATMNAAIFESTDGRSAVIESLCKLKEPSEGEQNDSFIVVSRVGNYESLCKRVCDSIKLDESATDDAIELEITTCSVHAFLGLDALCNFMKELVATGGNALGNSPPHGFAVTSKGRRVDTSMVMTPQLLKTICSPISSGFHNTLFEEGGPDRPSGQQPQMPEPKSIVNLNGRTAIPCVCEIPAECMSLFSDNPETVVSDGVTWQSLYLVFFGPYMILAEPEREGTGGNGRVVTACVMTDVTIEKDKSPPEANGSPAKRLLLTHRSFDLEPPGLLVKQKENNAPAPFLGAFTGLKYVSSRLDVWFEDQSAADHAFKMIHGRIMTAKSRRGERLLRYLAQES